MRSLSIEVFGDPVPQGSKRAVVHRSTGKAVMFEGNSARLRTWRSEIVSALRAIFDGDPFPGPVKVSIFFFLRRPLRPRYPLPTVRPDVDKLTRAVLDAIEAAGVIRNDAQVVTLSARKRYGDPPRVQVMIVEESSS